MKKIFLTLIAALAVVAASAEFPKALYIKLKNQDNFLKYNFGVANTLQNINNEGLVMQGYGMGFGFDEIDYISFSAPVDMSGMTPDEQKDRLVRIGEKIDSIVDLHDMEDLIVGLTRFTDIYADYYLDPIYYDVHSAGEPSTGMPQKIRSFVSALKNMAKLQPAAANEVVATAVDLYQASDYLGVFQAFPGTHRWDKVSESTEELVVRFPAETDGDFYSVVVTPSRDNNRDWETSDFNVRIPHNIQVNVNYEHGGVITPLSGGYLTISAYQNSLLSIILNYTISDKYYISSQNNIRQNIITTSTNINKKAPDSDTDTHILTAQANVEGKNLLDYEQWKSDVEAADGNESNNWEGDGGDAIMAHFAKCDATVALLDGELVIKSYLNDLNALYGEIEDTEIERAKPVIDMGKGTITYVYDDREKVAHQIKYFNDNLDATFYYDNKMSVMQGSIFFDELEDVDEYTTSGYWDETTQQYVELGRDFLVKGYYYDVMPCMMFPDMSAYAFDDESYFNEANFGKLITDYKDIVKTYEIISGKALENDYLRVVADGSDVKTGAKLTSEDNKRFYGFATIGDKGFKLYNGDDLSSLNYGSQETASNKVSQVNYMDIVENGNSITDLEPGYYWFSVRAVSGYFSASKVTEVVLTGSATGYNGCKMTSDATGTKWSADVTLESGNIAFAIGRDGYYVEEFSGTPDKAVRNYDDCYTVEAGNYHVTFDISSYPCKFTIEKR